MRFLRREPSTHETDRLTDQLKRVRAKLATAQRVLVLTGAGISVGAGLPTFRGPGGLYSGPDGIPSFMHGDALPDSLTELWQFWGPRRAQVRAAEPTDGHRVLAAWQHRRVREGAEVTLVTTNVDDLHERGGSDPVHHLHGELFTSTCMAPDCGGRVDGDSRSDGTPTPCPECGRPMRLKAVLFGEQVDLDALWAAKRAVRECDAFVAIGTSGSVYPGSGLARYARDVGARSIVVNPAEDAGLGFDEHVRLPSDVALPALLGEA
ncbi:MAG: SIR2 family NAD-dependent protein deacylase [Oryzihumus sp.]